TSTDLVLETLGEPPPFIAEIVRAPGIECVAMRDLSALLVIGVEAVGPGGSRGAHLATQSYAGISLDPKTVVSRAECDRWLKDKLEEIARFMLLFGWQRRVLGKARPLLPRGLADFANGYLESWLERDHAKASRDGRTMISRALNLPADCRTALLKAIAGHSNRLELS